jgi:hypothetical protein
VMSKFLCAPTIGLDTPTEHWQTDDRHSLA